MRSNLHFKLVVLLAPLLFSGCASRQPGLVLDPIGPPAGPPTTGSTGTLRVFSAFDTAPDFNPLRYRRGSSSYNVLTSGGRLVRAVAERNAQRESLETVALAVVKAR